MLAGACAFHLDRALDQAFIERLGLLELRGVVRIDQEHQVEIAVANVAHQRDWRDIALDVLHRLGHAFGQARDGNANVGGDRTGARAQLQAGEVRVMAGFPEFGAVLRPGRPDEILAAVFLGDLLHHLGLLDNRSRGAVEFEEQRRRHAVVRFAVPVDRLDRVLADDLGPRDGHPGLDDLDHGLRAAIDRIERANRGGHCLLHRVQLDGHFGDDAQRAFRPHEQAREVVPGGRLLRAAGRADDPPVRQYHGQREDIFAHGAVAHGVGARGPRRGHASERCVGARIYRKEQARVADMLVQGLARDAGLNHRIEVFFVDCEHLVHLRQVDAHPAFNRERMSLEGSAHAVRNHRHPVAAADVHHVAHFFGGMGEHDRVRRSHREVGLVLAMVFADAHGGGNPVAEKRLKIGDHALVKVSGFIHDNLLTRASLRVERRAACVRTRLVLTDLF